MAEQVNLQPIKTDVTIIGKFIEIFTYYVKSPKLIYAFISNIVKNLNGVNFLENHLGIVNDGYDNTDFYLNPMGELIVFSDIAEDFDIDDMGELTLQE